MRALTFLFLSLVSVFSFSSAELKLKPKNLTAIAFKNPKVDKKILFIHGTPGSREAFSYYINDKDLREKASMLSVDRIGFGKFHNQAETRLEMHSLSILKTAIYIMGENKIICVGHSYGATICLDLITRHPERFEKAVLIAGGFNPNRKILRWYNHVASSWPLRSLLPKSLINSNKEMIDLKKQLQGLEKKIKLVKTPTLIVHGLKDRIVPHADSVWLHKKLKTSGVEVSLKTYDSAGHFIIWKQQEKIKADLLNLL